MKIGDLVRFNHEHDGGPVHRVVSVMSDGTLEMHDMGGYFAPHLFVAATDIADIPTPITNGFEEKANSIAADIAKDVAELPDRSSLIFQERKND